MKIGYQSRFQNFKNFFDFFEKQFRFVPLFSPISRGSNSCNAKSDYIKKGG